MHFFQLLKSLDELLYEVMSWLVFYPITLWRTVRHPMRMMAYAGAQQADDVQAPYGDTLSPPIFLLLTVLFAHGVELAAVGESSIVADTRGLAGLVSDDTSLIVMRLIAFSVFPVVVASSFVRRTGRKLDRDTLERPFYAQCYATAPYALAFSLAATLSQMDWAWGQPATAAMVGVATLGWLALQTVWFTRQLATGPIRGFIYALWAYVQCLAVLVVLAWLMGGEGF